MIEESDDLFYQVLKSDYSQCVVDYAILKSQEDHRGVLSHREAVKCGLSIFSRNYRGCLSFHEDKMFHVSCLLEELLREAPSCWPWRDVHQKGRCFDIPSPLTYWFAFCEPPYGSPYGMKDFRRVNGILGLLESRKEFLEIYQWNDDFSDYFDAGKKWWGCGMWSIYDRERVRYVVIGASSTD